MKFGLFPKDILSQYVQAVSVGAALQIPEGLGLTDFTTARRISNVLISSSHVNLIYGIVRTL
jgi:hypothetical protein